jgi:autoinducer 2-degrading protein
MRTQPQPQRHGVAFLPPNRYAYSRNSENQSLFMLVVHVQVRVKPEHVEAFKLATQENARQSVQEPGIAAFDVVQQEDDSTRFVLVEAYRTPQAPAAHKETQHYATWRDTVAPMMSEPRTSVKFRNLFPSDENW